MTHKPLTRADVARLRAIAEQAGQEVERLCAGPGRMTPSGLAGRSWTMRVPATEDDSDMLFSRLAEALPALLDALERMDAALADLCEAYDIYEGSCDCGECDAPCLSTRVLAARLEEGE